MSLLHLYRTPGFSSARREALLATARERISPGIQAIQTEYCFNIDAAGDLAPDEFRTLGWLLSETFEPTRFGRLSFLQTKDGKEAEGAIRTSRPPGRQTPFRFVTPAGWRRSGASSARGAT